MDGDDDAFGASGGAVPAGAPPPASYGAPPPPGFGPRPAAGRSPPVAASLAAPFPASFGAPAPAAPRRAPSEPLGASLEAPKARGGLLSKVKSFLGGSGSPEAPPPPLEAPPPAPPPQAARPPAPPSPRADGSDAYSPAMLDDAGRKGVGELDLVFLVDETGSMGAYIEEVKRRLLELLDALRAAPLCRSLRVGIVSYRDHPPQDTTFASRVVPLTDDLAAIQAGVERMAANGGGDGPESVTDGLYDLVRLDFRPRAARVVVWVGDAPPHGVEPHGDGFPERLPLRRTTGSPRPRAAARWASSSTRSAACRRSLGYVGAVEVFKTVARTTRGLYLPLSEASAPHPARHRRRRDGARQAAHRGADRRGPRPVRGGARRRPTIRSGCAS